MKFIFSCVILLVMQSAWTYASKGDYRCVENTSNNKCQLIPEKECGNLGSNQREVDYMMCWGLQQGRSNQSCNYCRRNTLCQRNCDGKRCAKTGHQCPGKHSRLIGLFRNDCEMIYNGCRAAKSSRREMTVIEFQKTSMEKCKRLKEGKIYRYKGNKCI